MEIKESDLKFQFDDDIHAVKFDDTAFYRTRFNRMPSAKGVDIVADSSQMLQLIEIKNCSGHEAENLWRTSVNNSKLESAPSSLDVTDRDSLDIEMAKKVASTICCLYGAWTKAPRSPAAEELATVWACACHPKIPTDEKQLMVILFLEGDFEIAGSKTRNKRMIMHRLQESIQGKLSWLNCKVAVVDSDTYSQRCFSVCTDSATN
jgi:hypothetical protein